MKIRALALLGALSVVAIGLVAVTVATENTVNVQFVDTSGVPIVDNGIGVYDSNGEIVQKLPGRVTYDIIAEKGTKVMIDLEDPVIGKRIAEAYIPMLFVEPLLITVPDNPSPFLAPLNDLCADAQFVAVPSVTAGTTVDATTDSEQPACPGTGITSPGVWYEFIGTGNTVTADLCNGATGYDSKLSSYCLDCDAPTCASDANDDACGLQSAIDICTQAGNTYRVLVHGFGGATGSFELTLSDSGVPCSGAVDCYPPEPEGACCDCSAPPGNCEIMTATMCDMVGGDYQGDDVGCTDTSDAVVYSSMPNVPIPDANPAGVSDTISVPDANLIGDVNVRVVINHTWIGDLIMTLTHPSGQQVLLWDRACSSEDNLDVTFDDDGGVLVCASPTVGAYTPVSADGEPLGILNGLSTFGDWTLNVSDNAGADLGTLLEWSIMVSSGTPTCPDQNDGTCFLCDGTGGGGDDEDEDEDGDAGQDTEQIEIGIPGGLIDLMAGEQVPNPSDFSADDDVEEDLDRGQRVRTRRTTRSR